ncbi:MAG TPA: nucleotidyltransferase family protein [Terriglobia bacterium]|nr:nucleotidyltransferase family protein [Terriglobia bacterium]
MTVDPVAGLVLAAGESRRMGRDKALLEYQGQPFLEVILGNLRNAGISRVVVVLGHNADRISNAVHLGDAEVVINSDYHLGQTSSLQAGLRALDPSEVAGVLLCLVDHPAASAAVMRKLQDAFQQTGATVVIPVHQERRGHPVLISQALFKELLALDPAQGANTVIHKYLNTTYLMEVDDAGVLLDIDEPGDYQNRRQRI